LLRLCALATGRRGVAAPTIKTAEGHPGVNPLVRIASQAMDDMRRIGAEFRLSPNARLRLSGITPPPPPSKFGDLLK
jgi:phage terminase small subunit